MVAIAVCVFLLSQLKDVVNKYPDVSASVPVFFLGYWIGSFITGFTGIELFKWLLAALFVYKGRPIMLRFYQRKRIIRKKHS